MSVVQSWEGGRQGRRETARPSPRLRGFRRPRGWSLARGLTAQYFHNPPHSTTRMGGSTVTRSRRTAAARRTGLTSSLPPCTPFKNALTIRSPAAATAEDCPSQHAPKAAVKNPSCVKLDFEKSSVSHSSTAVAAAVALDVCKPECSGSDRRALVLPAGLPTSPAASSRLPAKKQTEGTKVDESSFVLKLETQDVEEARRAVRYARLHQRPLLLRGLFRETVKSFTPDQLQCLPEDVKVCADDKTGIGFQPLRDWGVPHKRVRKPTAAAVRVATAKKGGSRGSDSSQSGSSNHNGTIEAEDSTGGMPSNWGRIASIMSEKPLQTRLWARFMQKDLFAFRTKTGHSALADFAASIHQGCKPMSSNMIVTGNAAPSAAGRCFEMKSDAHQDEYHNFMVVASGAKIWALAALTEEQVAKGRKTKGRLSSSFRLDAVDRTKNRTPEEHEVAGLFETVWMGPGDVLFNPAWVWHQVNSEPQTLAYSVMYPVGGGGKDARVGNEGR